MSTLRVDTIYNRAKTTSPAIGVRPAVNDDSTKAVDSGWVQLELNDLQTQTRTVSGDRTFTGNVDLSGATLAFPSTYSFIAAWVSFTSAGSIESSNNIISVVKSATGVYDITFSVTMASATYGVLATGTRDDCEPHYTTRTTTTVQIRSENQSGTNIDTACTVMILGATA